MSTILLMEKKKIINIILLVTLPITTGLATFFIVRAIDQYNYEKKQQKLYQSAYEMHYNDRCALFMEENKHLSNVDVSFIGDSLTEGYDVRTYYPQYNVVNRGIGGDTTFGVEKRLKVSAYDVNPKVATLLIGANNFDTMFDNYENILKGFKENISETKIILLSLTSMTKEWGRNNQKAQINNEKIKEYANQYGYTYVDLYNPLLDENTNELRLEYTTDGGHLTPLGYEKITSIIEPVISKQLNK